MPLEDNGSRLRHVTQNGTVIIVETDEHGVTVSVEGYNEGVIVDDGGGGNPSPQIGICDATGVIAPSHITGIEGMIHMTNWECETCGDGCHARYRSGVRGILVRRGKHVAGGIERCDLCAIYGSDIEAAAELLKREMIAEPHRVGEIDRAMRELQPDVAAGI